MTEAGVTVLFCLFFTLMSRLRPKLNLTRSMNIIPANNNLMVFPKPPTPAYAPYWTWSSEEQALMCYLVHKKKKKKVHNVFFINENHLNANLSIIRNKLSSSETLLTNIDEKRNADNIS